MLYLLCPYMVQAIEWKETSVIAGGTFKLGSGSPCVVVNSACWASISWPYLRVNIYYNKPYVNFYKSSCIFYNSHTKKTVTYSELGNALEYVDGSLYLIDLRTVSKLIRERLPDATEVMCLIGERGDNNLRVFFEPVGFVPMHVKLTPDVVNVTAKRGGEWITTPINISVPGGHKLYVRTKGRVNFRSGSTVYRFDDGQRYYLTQTPMTSSPDGSVKIYSATFQHYGQLSVPGTKVISVIFDIVAL